MGIGVQEAGARRAREQEPLIEGANSIPLGFGSILDDGGHARAINPLTDDDVRGSSYHVWNPDIWIALKCRGEGALILRFAKVVEFLDCAHLQLFHQRLNL